MKNNIYIFCPVFLPYAGGGASYFPLLSNELIKKQNSVTIYTEYHPQNSFISLSSKINVKRPFFKRDSVKSNKTWSIISFFINYFIYIYYTFKISYLDRSAILIHTRYYNSFYIFYLRFLKLIFKNITLVNDVRTTFEHKFLSYNFNFFDITFSNSLATDIQIRENKNLSGKNYLYVENFLELPNTEKSYLSPFKFKVDKFYLFIGTLSKRKSFNIVLNVIQNLIKKGEKLVIVGRSVDFNLDFIKSHFKTKDFIYFERLDKDKIYYLQKHAKLVLLPSIKEGLPRVALETLKFHGRIVLPPCCPEFKTKISNKIPNKENVLKEAILRLNKDYEYDVNKHSVKVGFSKYYRFLTEKCNLPY